MIDSLFVLPGKVALITGAAPASAWKQPACSPPPALVWC